MTDGQIMDVRGCPESACAMPIGANAGSAGEIMFHQIAALEHGHVREVAAVAEVSVILMERGLYAACIAVYCLLFCGLNSAVREQP